MRFSPPLFLFPSSSLVPRDETNSHAGRSGRTVILFISESRSSLSFFFFFFSGRRGRAVVLRFSLEMMPKNYSEAGRRHLALPFLPLSFLFSLLVAAKWSLFPEPTRIPACSGQLLLPSPFFFFFFSLPSSAGRQLSSSHVVFPWDIPMRANSELKQKTGLCAAPSSLPPLSLFPPPFPVLVEDRKVLFIQMTNIENKMTKE